MNPGWKSSHGISFTDDEENDVGICIIQIDQGTMLTYTLYLYKSHYNVYNKYNFLMSLANITKNNIKIYII